MTTTTPSLFIVEGVTSGAVVGDGLLLGIHLQLGLQRLLADHGQGFSGGSPDLGLLILFLRLENVVQLSLAFVLKKRMGLTL